MNAENIKIELKVQLEKFQKQMIEFIDSNYPKEPPQPEGYQGLNKWYVTNYGSTLYVQDFSQYNCYGTNVDGKWKTTIYLTKYSLVRLATPEEIKQAILKGCEQHGIVEGARVKGLSISTYTEVLDFKSIKYDHKRNTLHISVVNDLPMVHACVFDNGTFAEVVKEEYSKEQKEPKKQDLSLES